MMRRRLQLPDGTSLIAAVVAAAMAAAFVAGCGGGGGGTPAAAPAPVAPPVVPPVVPPVQPPVQPPAPSPGSYADPVSYSGAPGAALASAEERAAVVPASITLAGKSFAYTATTGHLTAVDAPTGKAGASFFYVAYTAGTQEPGKRPLTFFYNGGPGSASMWLHLGSFGPRRIATNALSVPTPVPAQLVDNQETLLGHSDLVFVDAIGTGFSQAVAPNTNQSFWGVDRDAAAFRDFVQRYIAVNKRQASPTYLFGESYGAPRTAVLANLLENAGVKISGVVLLSAAMNYNSNCGVLDPGAVSCEGYIPSYAAVSAYHKTANPLPADLASDFSSYIAHARAFSAANYRPEVAAFLVSKASPSDALITQLVAFTGLPALTWRQDLDMGPGAFRARLLPGTVIGRYDGRVSAAAGSALAAGGDPSINLVNAAFTQGIGSYISGELRYTAASPYLSFNNLVEQWNFKHDGKELPDTIPDLAAALAQNPAMKVLAQGGYHDLATPFYQTELDLARLGAQASITIRNYHSGHMAYLDETARRAQRADLIDFYNSTSVAP